MNYARIKSTGRRINNASIVTLRRDRPGGVARSAPTARSCSSFTTSAQGSHRYVMFIDTVGAPADRVSIAGIGASPEGEHEDLRRRTRHQRVVRIGPPPRRQPEGPQIFYNALTGMRNFGAAQ